MEVSVALDAASERAVMSIVLVLQKSEGALRGYGTEVTLTQLKDSVEADSERVLYVMRLTGTRVGVGMTEKRVTLAWVAPTPVDRGIPETAVAVMTMTISVEVLV